jgi:hypothetical protein
MKRPFTSAAHIGYTHNPQARGGFAHSVIEFSLGKPPVLACGLYGQCMEIVCTFEEPKREVCPDCAEFVRADLLRVVVERFGPGMKFSDADASGFVRDLAKRAAFVLPVTI